MCKNNRLRRNISKDGFILIEPKALDNSERVAKAMAMCKGVSKVFLTSGDYGFVVSTRESGKHDHESINSAILRMSGNARAKVAKGHLVYACIPRTTK